MNAGDGRRTALVTGCSSGLGLLSAVELARQGLRVFASMRDLEKRAALQREAGKAGVTLDLLALDVTDRASMARAMDRIGALAGHVDVLVNNAGLEIWGSVEEQSIDEIRAQFETNFFGAVMSTQAVLPGMRDRGWGRIINVSSINGRVALPMISGYVASKFALEGFSEALRLEAASDGVFVSLIEPGGFWTELFTANRRFARASTPETRDYARTRQLFERVARMVRDAAQDPRAVAHAVVTAATAQRPRLRYVVGRDARILGSLRALLPQAGFDAGVRWMFR